MAQELIDRAIFFLTDIYSKLIIKLVVAVIIILIGFIIGKFIGRIVFKILKELDINSYFRKATGLNISPDSIISKTITYLIDFFVIIVALDAIALTPSIIYVLSGAVIVIIVFSIIIGIKDIIPNIVAGLFLYRRKKFREGDKIQLNGHFGKIKRIDLTETIIEKKNKNLLYVPNSSFLKSEVTKLN
jgi:small-conductance mechanosensitive channel